MKIFNSTDMFVNTIKVYPKTSIFMNNGKTYYNGEVNDGNIQISLLKEPILEAVTTESEIFLITQLGNILLTEQDY